ncbi:UDP-N-acetylmuramoyl-L-alanine--D-glutamate ligase [Acidisoma cellulosilytica]|uniref:UDP-N-acetylmuramoylalanine--D-glutamate ligase n=1 Tax=Acidisoma cellulosilyticum TaxID=2802395 RepID=A0A963YX78_9PROT|nr:UDP-N-acetylmuramoyl-L-alanine--D-glutamate ligase [Acidisoma cellulosilyticum]MCB8878803.1 UDP-N-acetylmuramoyl-L-alanine--D-glutamate ligase [Acidisoma cellulosilyticum]
MTGFPANLFAGARFAILGLGKNGLPAARALRAMGAEVALWDDGEAARTAAAGEGFTLSDLMAGDFAYDALVLSPGIPHSLPQPHPVAARAIAKNVPILSDAELLYQAVRKAGSKAHFAGVTGTNGKSTTTALLAHILTESGVPTAAGGNLGPASLALPLLPDDGVYVLEMSSYMLERIATLRFSTAAMLNLSPDHFERHGNMDRYAAVKRAVFARQTADDTAVVGVDDARSVAMAESLESQGPMRVVKISGIGQATGALALPGEHNAQNAAAATALARALGVSDDAIAQGIRTYPGLPHRQARVGSQDGIIFINDSKATNADAAARALGCYDRIVWIAGGIAKAGGIAPLASFFPRIAHVELIGQDAPQFAETLAAHNVPFHMAETLDAAVPAAFAKARALGAPVVLLSPATASWDQFSGFEARGDRFAELVAALRPSTCQGEAA